jgi:hypothetical protein
MIEKNERDDRDFDLTRDFFKLTPKREARILKRIKGWTCTRCMKAPVTHFLASAAVDPGSKPSEPRLMPMDPIDVGFTLCRACFKHVMQECLAGFSEQACQNLAEMKQRAVDLKAQLPSLQDLSGDVGAILPEPKRSRERG